MGKHILWNSPVRQREIHGYTFLPGQTLWVENEEKALDILTQPGEPFVEVNLPAPPEASPEPVEGPVEETPEASPGKLTDITGIGPKYARELGKLGVITLADLADLTQEQISSLSAGPDQVRQWIVQAQKIINPQENVNNG